MSGGGKGARCAPQNGMHETKNSRQPILNEVRARTLSYPEIIESLEAAVRLAQGGTSGGRVMARVLLAAYNGYRFPLDLSDLAILGDEAFEHALNVIRLRHMGHEPHNFFVDGGDLFEAIADGWGFEP